MPTFCDKCGNELKNENVKFCDKCGAKISINKTDESEIPESGIICPHCGKTSPIGQPNCSNCGGEIELENNVVAVAVGYIVIWILNFLGIIPAIYLLTRRNKKSKTQGVILLIISILLIINSFMMGYSATFTMLFILIIGTVVGVAVWLTDYTFTFLK